MDKEISICKVVPGQKKIEVVVRAKKTFLNVRMICSFLLDKKKIASFEPNCFDLFEGEQSLLINHCFSDICINGLTYTIEIMDYTGKQIGWFSKHIYDAGNKADIQRFIKVTGEIERSTEGGCITINIGGIPYRIHAHYNEVLEMCKDYISMDDPKEDIIVGEEEIIKEKRELDRLLKYPPTKSAIEAYALRKKVSDSIVDYGGFQIHGAAIAVDDQCYIFTADSGTGKTTHIQLWLKNLCGSFVVNGDQPIIKIGQEIQVYGSPWCGKERMNTNIAVPLKAIIIMERSNKNVLIEISMKEAVFELLRQVYKPTDPDKYRKTLQLLSCLEGKIKFYRFEFNNFAEDAFSASYNAVHFN